MSTPATATCEHDWEDTGLQTLLIGRRSFRTLVADYCVACHRFSYRAVSLSLRDETITHDEADARNTREHVRHNAERQSWLAEHYPEQVEEAS